MGDGLLEGVESLYVIGKTGRKKSGGFVDGDWRPARGSAADEGVRPSVPGMGRI